MKNKKANIGLVVVIVVGVIFVALLVTGLIIANQKGYFNRKEPVAQNNTIVLYLMARDVETLEPIDANYILDYTYNSLPIKLSEGKLTKDSWVELKNIPNDKMLHVYGWSNDYYLVKASKQFGGAEILENKSSFNVDMQKIGKIEVTHKGDLKNEENIIKLNITAKDGWFYRLSAVISWSPGIVNVYMPSEILVCDNNVWLNYTHYDQTSKVYTYLENNLYRCGENRFEVCEFVDGRNCKIKEQQIPSRFMGKVDSNIYIGKTLEPGESHEIELIVKTLEHKNDLDFLEITFYDQDRRWNINENMLTRVSEENGVDIGCPDYKYTIKYGM